MYNDLKAHFEAWMKNIEITFRVPWQTTRSKLDQAQHYESTIHHKTITSIYSIVSYSCIIYIHIYTYIYIYICVCVCVAKVYHSHIRFNGYVWFSVHNSHSTKQKSCTPEYRQTHVAIFIIISSNICIYSPLLSMHMMPTIQLIICNSPNERRHKVVPARIYHKTN